MHVICGSGGAYSAHVHVACAVVASSFKLNVTSVISRARGTAHQTAHTSATLSRSLPDRNAGNGCPSPAKYTLGAQETYIIDCGS